MSRVSRAMGDIYVALSDAEGRFHFVQVPDKAEEDEFGAEFARETGLRSHGTAYLTTVADLKRARRGRGA